MREVVNLPDLIVTEIDGIKLVQSGAQVLNQGDLVTSKIKFSVFASVGVLASVQHKVGGQLHHGWTLFTRSVYTQLQVFNASFNVGPLSKASTVLYLFFSFWPA